jgi:TetR/AcrR family transcriptional regulator
MIKAVQPKAKSARKSAGSKLSSAKRAAGRPARAGNGVGAAALIEATCDLLKEIGPERITLAEVARRSNVDPKLIRYYFNDRASLLRATVDSLSHRYQEFVDARLSGTDSAEDQLRKRFETFLEFQLEYPYFRRLLVDEIIPSVDPAAEKLLREVSERGVGNYQQILAQGAAEGTIREVDPQLFYICLIGMQEMATVGAPILRKLGHPAIDSPDYARIFSKFAMDLILQGLKTNTAD